jgi:hypothetical protein
MQEYQLIPEAYTGDYFDTHGMYGVGVGIGFLQFPTT